MSKITKALEKAARDRKSEHEERVTVTAKPAEVPLLAPASSAGPVRELGPIRIDPHIVVASDPQSPISEQYRILRTNLQSLKKYPDFKTLLITSSVRGEGKSVTATNLALSLAQQEGTRVLLIDADLRRGGIHNWLGFEAKRGLTDALSTGVPVDELIVRLQQPALSVLPAGQAPEHPAELLSSPTMKKVLERLRMHYDMIIIDAPPVLPVSDPGILGRLVDGALFVIRSGRTQQRIVLQAYALLKQAKVRMLGSVLTHVEHYIPGYYRYYHYYRNEERANGHSRPVVNGNGTSHRTAEESTE